MVVAPGHNKKLKCRIEWFGPGPLDAGEALALATSMIRQEDMRLDFVNCEYRSPKNW